MTSRSAPRSARKVLSLVITRFSRLPARLDAESFYRSVNAVRPGIIRVAADESSYHLHIVLRYELEVALISGSLGIRDLTEAWNERSASLIGTSPTSDREGVLQDVHWSLGMFGYFPTYTLGSLYAAQLAETYAREHPLEDEIRRGEFGGLLSWLRTNIHRVGQVPRPRKSSQTPLARGSVRGPFSATFKRSACPDGRDHKRVSGTLSEAAKRARPAWVWRRGAQGARLWLVRFRKNIPCGDEHSRDNRTDDKSVKSKGGKAAERGNQHDIIGHLSVLAD